MGVEEWTSTDREEAEEFLRKRKTLTDDELIKISHREKLRSKPVPWENWEKSSQYAISVTGSARAGHGHFTGRPIPDLTIGDTFRALYSASPRLQLFRKASNPDEAVENVRVERQKHVDWFIEHFEHVIENAPDIVDYEVINKDKSIFGLTTSRVLNRRSNASSNHPHITSTLEQYVIAAKLFSDMDAYPHRSAVRERFGLTLADRTFNFGGGDCYLVDVQAMRRHGQSLNRLERLEHSSDDVAALAQRGVIVNHERTPSKLKHSRAKPNDEWVYVRSKSAPGSSDGLAFALAGYLGGWGLAAAGRHFDNLDTWIKWSKDYAHGEFDALIADRLENGHPRVREILERFRADELSDVFTYLIAQDNSPSGTPFRQSTGMVPHYRKFREYADAHEVLLPLGDEASEERGPGFASHYQLHLPIAAENLASIGQSLPANAQMPTDWKFVASKPLGEELRTRLEVVEKFGFPAHVDPEIVRWVLGDDRRTFDHGKYLGRPVMSRHAMPFDLTPLGGTY